MKETNNNDSELQDTSAAIGRETQQLGEIKPEIQKAVTEIVTYVNTVAGGQVLSQSDNNIQSIIEQFFLTAKEKTN